MLRGFQIQDTSIVQSLIDADLVIADVTDGNANVFYELGVRHALRRGTIIVSQGTGHVPSDLRGYWYLPYGVRPADIAKFKSEVKRLVAAFEKYPDASDSPVSDYLDRGQISSSKRGLAELNSSVETDRGAQEKRPSVQRADGLDDKARLVLYAKSEAQLRHNRKDAAELVLQTFIKPHSHYVFSNIKASGSPDATIVSLD